MSVVLPMAFLSLVMQPACDYAVAQSYMTLPAGIAVMWITGPLELVRHRNLTSVCWAIAWSIAVAVALHFAAPWLPALGKWNLAIFFAGFVSMGVFAGIPIAFCFGLVTLAYLQLTTPIPLSPLLPWVH